MTTVVINGSSYSSNGSITVTNGRVIIDGVDKTPDGKEITISITGDVTELSVDACKAIHVVQGNVKNLRTTSGDVFCGAVTGNVTTTSGDIECEGIGGDVNSTSGDISAASINGSVKTLSGDIKYKK